MYRKKYPISTGKTIAYVGEKFISYYNRECARDNFRNNIRSVIFKCTKYHI